VELQHLELDNEDDGINLDDYWQLEVGDRGYYFANINCARDPHRSGFFFDHGAELASQMNKNSCTQKSQLNVGGENLLSGGFSSSSEEILKFYPYRKIIAQFLEIIKNFHYNFKLWKLVLNPFESTDSFIFLNKLSVLQ
jgi:hypothetical protein